MAIPPDCFTPGKIISSTGLVFESKFEGKIELGVNFITF